MEVIGRYVRKLLLELLLAVQKQAGVFAERLKSLEQSDLEEVKNETIRSGPDMQTRNTRLYSGGPPPHWVELVRNDAPELLQPPQPYQTHSISSRVFSFQSAAQDFEESAQHITNDRLPGWKEFPESPDIPEKNVGPLQKSGAADPVENRDNEAFRQTMIQNTEPCLPERRIKIRPQSIAERHFVAGQQFVAPQSSQRIVSDMFRDNPPTEIRNHTVNNGAYMTVKKDRDPPPTKLSAKSSPQKGIDSERISVGDTHRFGNNNESAPVLTQEEFSSAASDRINEFETIGQDENEISIKRPLSVEFSGVQNNGKQRQDRLREQPWPNLLGDQESKLANSSAAMEPWPTLPQNPVTATKLFLHQELPGRFENDWREMDRLRRINSEQKGVSWNESHF